MFPYAYVVPQHDAIWLGSTNMFVVSMVHLFGFGFMNVFIIWVFLLKIDILKETEEDKLNQ